MYIRMIKCIEFQQSGFVCTCTCLGLNYVLVLFFLYKVQTLYPSDHQLKVFIFITQTCPCNIQQYFTAVKNINFKMKNYNIFFYFCSKH